jgi:hypothetical protein
MSQCKPNKILLLIAIMFCGTAGLLFAQEGGGNPINEGEDGYKPENQFEKHIPNIDLEGKFIIVKPSQSKDSIQIKPSNPGKSQINSIQSLEKESEKAHSSFNLFYYMFQKFKLNDIIDQ